MAESPALDRVGAALDAFFAASAPELTHRAGLVAFSAGPDSTALLAAAARRARRLGAGLTAAHVDHGLDAGSAGRAEAARRLAAALGVPVVAERREVAAERRSGESLEAAARRVRYGFLRRVAEERRAGWVATAHHRDDQAETVALRLLFGSGLRGLGAIRPVGELPAGEVTETEDELQNDLAKGGLLGRPEEPPDPRTGEVAPVLVRPVLALPRATLAAAAAEVAGEVGIAPVDDPTNRDLSVPRNLVRHRLLPALARESAAGIGTAGLAGRLASLADAADGAAATVDRTLVRHFGLAAELSLPLAELSALPGELLPHAAALLHARAGFPYPPPAEAVAELARQLAGWRREVTAVGCDCGGGRRWESRDAELVLAGPATRGAAGGDSPPPFSYTLRVPGEVAVPESGAVVRLRRAPLADWMLRGARDRAGLGIALAPGDEVTVRSRRPGDRIRPLGAPGSRRLKDLLIDRRVPRAERDRLPLLCVRGADGGERIAWVPGVAVDESCRLPAAGATDLATGAPAPCLAWVAEIASPR